MSDYLDNGEQALRHKGQRHTVIETCCEFIHYAKSEKLFVL